LQHVKERQAAGIAVARQRGVYKGRKPGATKAKPQRARELRAKGMSLPEIAQALSVDKRTVSAISSEIPHDLLTPPSRMQAAMERKRREKRRRGYR